VRLENSLMKVKKYLHPKKEKKVDHTNHYEQSINGSRCAKRHICQNYLNDVC
jgi:hypothetical protein